MLLASPRLRRSLPFGAALLALTLGWVLSLVLPAHSVFLGISMMTATIAVLGLGVVSGSAGIIALCQLTFSSIGAWVVAWMNVHQVAGGFVVWLIAGTVAAALVGVVIGLPALRLRGVNLAVVTLGFAASWDALLLQTQFPGQSQGLSIDRPALFVNDRSYFMFALIVLLICVLLVFFLQSSRIGSSWKAVAFSERGTAAVGQSVRAAKLSAFAVSAALGGISGGLLAGQLGIPYESSFAPVQSVALYVLAVVSGAYLIDMAIMGGVLWVLIPELLKRWGVPQDWGFVVFGVLGIQAITSGSNLGETLRTAARKSRWHPHHAQGRHASTSADDVGTSALNVFIAPEAATPLPESHPPVLDVRDLTVKFGALTALKEVSFTVQPRTIMGLIGPNGAGKSTFVDAVTGFLPRRQGWVLLERQSTAQWSPMECARIGIRRTFQQDRVPTTLTVDAYVRFVTRKDFHYEELRDVLYFLGCPPPEARLEQVDVGTRRLVEVAAAALSGPQLLILDEPAAGLSHHEHVRFGERLAKIPERFNTAIILIEHDLDLIRSVCTQVTVLNFGQVIASGPQEEVLADPRVIAAYMGDSEHTA